MPRVCTICTHPERVAIDKALIAGEPYRNIAERFGTSATALTRHKSEHLSDTLVKATAAKETADADDLLADIRMLRARADRLYTLSEGLLGKALAANNLNAAVGAIRAAIAANQDGRANIELLGELAGKLERRAQVNIIMSPQWSAVYGILMAALGPHPELRATVAEGLMALEAGDAGE